MIPYKPAIAYITPWAAENPQALQRAERLAAAMGINNLPVISKSDLADMLHSRGWDRWVRTGALNPDEGRDVIFNAFRWDDSIAQDIATYPPLQHWSLAGHGAWTYRDEFNQIESMDTACQSAWELHSAFGCFHHCKYCHVGSLLNLMCNLEDLRDHLPQMFALAPEQRLYKYDNQTDTICFEPEYGASEILVPYFAEQENRWLMLYTKSDNVDHLLDLPHGGKTLISWTLSPRRTAEEVELGAPSMDARLKAAALCQNTGYKVRFRFSPIVPLDSWRQDIREMVETVAKTVRPDLLTIDVLGWMRPGQMLDAMDVEAYDPRFRDEVHAAIAANETKPFKHFFSHGLRKEILETTLRDILELLPGVTVSMCNETFAMWDDIGYLTQMTPDNYACCCGPDSVPGCRGL